MSDEVEALPPAEQSDAKPEQYHAAPTYSVDVLCLTRDGSSRWKYWLESVSLREAIECVAELNMCAGICLGFRVTIKTER